MVNLKEMNENFSMPVWSLPALKTACPEPCGRTTAAFSAHQGWCLKMQTAAPLTAPCFIHWMRSPFVPLALSRFLRRATAGACKNRSAAPVCGALLLLRASPRPCKRQTAVLLRFPEFSSIKDDAWKFRPRRQAHLAASSTGRTSVRLPLLRLGWFAIGIEKSVYDELCIVLGRSPDVTWARHSLQPAVTL